MTGYLGMDLPGFFALVRSRARLITAIVAAAVLLALVASLLQSSRYRATADLLFGPSPAAEALDSGLGDSSGEIPERVAATNLALASLDGVAARVKTQLGASSSVDELDAAVEVQTTGDSDLGTVTAEWSTPEGAAEVANAFANQIVAMRTEAARADIRGVIDALSGVLAAQPPDATRARTRALQDQISRLQALAAVESGGVRVVEPASPPRERSSPRPLRNALIAGFVALVLSLLMIVVLARVEERIADEDRLAALVGAPVLARVPELTRQRASSPPSAVAEDPAFADAFEFLRLNLQLIRPAGGSVSYTITSATPGEGKTLITSRLAVALAESGAEVVAVDLDVRKPELDGYLNGFEEPESEPPPELLDELEGWALEAPANGRRTYDDGDVDVALTELALQGGNARRAARALKAIGLDISESTLRRWKVAHASLYAEFRATRSPSAAADNVPQPTLQPGLRLLTVADEPALAAMPSDRERLQRLLADLKARADYVLVDTVPVVTAADASAAAAGADGVILVVDLARLRTHELLGATRQLANARAKIVGVVLNRAAVEHAAYPAQPNGAGSLARQFADSSRATLRRVQQDSSARLASLIRRDEPRE